MKSIAKKTFTSPIGLENSYTNTYMGYHESTMELFAYPDGSYGIEWDVPALEITEHIGIWHEDKKVTDYDGVFELPKKAIDLLKENGFDTSDVE